MTYNKSEIMKKAWRKYNNLFFKKYTTFEDDNYSNLITVVITFGDMLKEAWAEAKEAVAAEKRAEAEKKAANDQRIIAIDKKLFLLNMTDRLSLEERETIRRLNEERNSLISEIQVA